MSQGTASGQLKTWADASLDTQCLVVAKVSNGSVQQAQQLPHPGQTQDQAAAESEREYDLGA